jgi:hypothetical protein
MKIAIYMPRSKYESLLTRMTFLQIVCFQLLPAVLLDQVLKTQGREPMYVCSAQVWGRLGERLQWKQ